MACFSLDGMPTSKHPAACGPSSIYRKARYAADRFAEYDPSEVALPTDEQWAASGIISWLSFTTLKVGLLPGCRGTTGTCGCVLGKAQHRGLPAAGCWLHRCAHACHAGWRALLVQLHVSSSLRWWHNTLQTALLNPHAPPTPTPACRWPTWSTTPAAPCTPTVTSTTRRASGGWPTQACECDSLGRA